MDTYSIFQYESIHFPINQKKNVDRIGFLMDTNYKSIPVRVLYSIINGTLQICRTS